MSSLPTAVEAAISASARADTGRLVACLAGRFRDLDLADEAVQDAYAEAVATWPVRGIPDQPPAWLLSVARRKAVDRLRRADSARRRTLAAAPDLLLAAEPDVTEHDDGPGEEGPMTIDGAGIADDQLRLILLCCHPALAPEAQVALTLKLVGGLTVPEIAAACLLPEATLAQRIVRAKRKIRAAAIPLRIPARFDDRVDVVLQVLYLIFNEGYLSRGPGEVAVRVDLTDQAIRLTATFADLVPGSSETRGLLALELFHRARSATRLDAAGELVLLDVQDRTRWDLARIETANVVLRDALALVQGDAEEALPTPGPLLLQAVIAGYHANARTAADTDWPAIVTAYDRLRVLVPTSVVAVNHAVAVAMADGPRAGLALLDRIDDADAYHLLHAARGELLLRADDPGAAVTAFARARALAVQPAEQRHLDRRLSAARAR